MKTLDTLQPWEKLMKTIFFQQLEEFTGLTVLDFGSGEGLTASFLAKNNTVTAVEPSAEMLAERCVENEYRQIVGGIEEVKKMPSGQFDLIICHNVLEYVEDKQIYLQELTRVLKKGGKLSIIKHNRAGRVMQNVVLLNNFKHARELLAGGNSEASKFGTIRYYEDADVTDWCPELSMESCRGIRTFWDLQQNQECHGDPKWRTEMVRMERMVEEIPEYVQIAFLHHMIFIKNR